MLACQPLPLCSTPSSLPAEEDVEKALEAFVTAEKLPAFLEFSQVGAGGGCGR